MLMSSMAGLAESYTIRRAHARFSRTCRGRGDLIATAATGTPAEASADEGMTAFRRVLGTKGLRPGRRPEAAQVGVLGTGGQHQDWILSRWRPSEL
jgi:hypothetical protein